MQATSFPAKPPLRSPDVSHTGASDLIGLLAGGPEVHLQGFPERKAIRAPWNNPGLPMIAVQAFDREAPELRRQAKAWRRFVYGSFLCSFLVLGLACGYLWGLGSMRMDLGPLAPWKMVEVLPGGVKILMGGSHVVIPVGGRLPNGDMVVTVYPSRSVAVLDGSTVMVRQSGQPTEQESKK